MAYGESGFAGQKTFRAENLWRFAFFVLVWPVTGFLTIIAVLGTNSVVEKVRSQLSQYARFAAAIAVGMLLPEVLGLIAQTVAMRIIVIDLALVLAWVARMVLAYARLAAVLLALVEVLGIIGALQAKMGADGIGFLFAWTLVAVVVARLGVVGCVVMALKQGMKTEPPEYVAEIFA